MQESLKWALGQVKRHIGGITFSFADSKWHCNHCEGAAVYTKPDFLHTGECPWGKALKVLKDAKDSE